MQMIQVLLQSRALQRRYVVEVRAVAVEIKAALSEELQEHLGEGSIISHGRSQTNTWEMISALSSDVCFSLHIAPGHISFPGEDLSWCLSYPLALQCQWLHRAPAGK